MARPRAFDPEEALADAMDLFWSQGYEATAPQELADRMHIAKSSLYNAFGGKRSLFELALRRYLEARTEMLAAMLASSDPAKEVLRRALVFMVRADLERPDRRGCLATNSVVELGLVEDAVTTTLRGWLADTEAAFRVVVERGQREGDIRADIGAAGVASMLLTTVTGLHALARIESGPERLQRAVAATLDLL